MIKVLIVEDSAVVREFLTYILSADPEIEIVGTADDGEAAVAAVRQWRPDVITMDIHMPRLNGLEATRRIMETHPTPIVIVSGSTDPAEVATTFAAVEAGALAVLARPAGIGHPDHETTARELLQTVKLMSEVRVVRRWRRQAAAGPVLPPPVVTSPSPVKIVALGASAGGPPVLQSILSALPASFPAPILIVQHIASGFTEGFVKWLNDSCMLRVELAVDGAPLIPGRAVIAPDRVHLVVRQDSRIGLTTDPPVQSLRPAVAALFRSLLATGPSQCAAGLLTGMGRDGAEELKLLRAAGATTFVQDRETAAVYGMPGEAIKLDAAMYVLSPERIAATLLSLTTRK